MNCPLEFGSVTFLPYKRVKKYMYKEVIHACVHTTCIILWITLYSGLKNPSFSHQSYHAASTYSGL